MLIVLTVLSVAQESVGQRLLAYLCRTLSSTNYIILLSAILEVNVFGTRFFHWHVVLLDMYLITPPPGFLYLL